MLFKAINMVVEDHFVIQISVTTTLDLAESDCSKVLIFILKNDNLSCTDGSAAATIIVCIQVLK